jgi:hypothetical protein
MINAAPAAVVFMESMSFTGPGARLWRELGGGSDIQPRVATLSAYGSFSCKRQINPRRAVLLDDTKLMSAGCTI